MCKDNNSLDYYYVAVRTAEVPVADQMCQVSHASCDAGRMFGIHEHCNVVVLDIGSEQNLLELSDELTKAGIRHTVQVECDDDLGSTALATEMVQGEQRSIFRKYSLWRS